MASPVFDPIQRTQDSIRRTSHIDIHPHELGLTLDGRARDLLTITGQATVIGAAGVRAKVDPQGQLVELETNPASANHTDLLGRQVAGGFRQAVHEAFPGDVAAGSPVALLLDDLPVATLISGYARLYSGDIAADVTRDNMQADICSGWRTDGSMMTSVGAGHGVPVTLGPKAPSRDIERGHDPIGWHEIGALPEGSMRRRRLVDVHMANGEWIVAAMFRDTHVEPGGSETVLHEYTVSATVDTRTGVFTSCAAVPRVLPWVECPVAAASADRLRGIDVTSTRGFVGRELRGTSTCTHLNDLLRSLGDVEPLVKTLIATTHDSEGSRQ